jgi:hypothetical protein
MKKYWSALFIIITTALYAQHGTDSLSAEKKPVKVTIQGTHVSMTIPQGFKPAKDFIGIEKDDKTYIEVFDPYENDYSTSSAGFSRPGFENQGMDVFAFKTLNVGLYLAKYAGMRNSSGYKKYELIFGDSSFSAMVLGHCSVNDDAVAKAIENTIMSVSYDKKVKVNPYIHSYFNMNDSASIFKFSKVSDKIFKYSMAGKLKLEAGEANVTITPFTLDAPMTDKEVKKTMEGIYKKDGMTGLKVKNESDTKINGYDAYESEVYGKLNGKQTLIYQLTVSSNGNALLIMGVTNTDMENNLAEFKKLAYTVSFKPATGK